MGAILLGSALYVVSAQATTLHKNELSNFSMDNDEINLLNDSGTDSFQSNWSREWAGSYPVTPLTPLHNQSSLLGEADFTGAIHNREKSEQGHMLSQIPNGIPLKVSARISSEYGPRLHPIKKKRLAHAGIDFSVPTGTPVHSTANGVIRHVSNASHAGYGKYVVVEHSFGFSSLYAHLESTGVKIGDIILKDSVIGKSGSTGQSTRPHLHYEVKYRDEVLDPKVFTQWTIDNYSPIFTSVTAVPWASLKIINSQMLQTSRSALSTKSYL